MNVQSLPNMHKAGIVILAAGNSSRLGGDIKQLLPWRNQTLLQHIITEADLAGLSPIVVVTGAYTEQVSASVTHLKVSLVYNPVWAKGKASGIVAGVQGGGAGIADGLPGGLVALVAGLPGLAARVVGVGIDEFQTGTAPVRPGAPTPAIEIGNFVRHIAIGVAQGEGLAFSAQ